MRTSLVIVAVLVLQSLMATPTHAAAACRTNWEYRIVDLDAADAVRVKAKQRLTASTGLIANLNRLGSQGWELASEHKVRIYEEYHPIGAVVDGKTPQPDWVAELNPSAALFRRATNSCP